MTKCLLRSLAGRIASPLWWLKRIQEIHSIIFPTDFLDLLSNAEEWCVAWPTGRKWNDWLQPRISCCGCYPFISPRCHAQAYTLYSEYNNALSMQTCNQTHKHTILCVCAADLNMDRDRPHLRRPAALHLLSKLCASCLSNTHFSLFCFFS